MSDTTKPEEIKWAELRPQMIKLVLELGPLLVFFAANAFGKQIIETIPIFGGLTDPLYPATAFFMVAMVISVSLSWLLLHRVAVMPLVTAAVVLVFGTLTFIFQDTTFIKMKPTVVNSLFGTVLLGGLLFGQSLLKYVFGEVYKLRPQGWFVLTLRWGLFFFVLAALNEVVWRFFPDQWVNFKVWGIMPLTILFSLLQLPVLTKYAPEPEPTETPAE
jgi:intracellular septation protein